MHDACKVVKPAAYWDRTHRVVRDWNSNQVLPDYEGECMVYMDVSGPVFMQTFLHNGERCWHDDGVLVSDLTVIRNGAALTRNGAN